MDDDQTPQSTVMSRRSKIEMLESPWGIFLGYMVPLWPTVENRKIFGFILERLLVSSS